MTVTCLAFSGVIAEDGLDTQGLSVGPTAPIAGAWGSTPASSLSSYTFDMTPAATVLGASHALRPVCPLIFLRGS